MGRRLIKRFLATFFVIAFTMSFRFGEPKTYLSADSQAPAFLMHKLEVYKNETGEVPQWMPYIFCGLPSVASLIYNPGASMPSLISDSMLGSWPGWILLSLWLAYQFEYNSFGKDSIRNYDLCFGYWFVWSICAILFLLFDSNFYSIVAKNLMVLAVTSWIVYIASVAHAWSRKQTVMGLILAHIFAWFFRLFA